MLDNRELYDFSQLSEITSLYTRDQFSTGTCCEQSFFALLHIMFALYI